MSLSQCSILLGYTGVGISLVITWRKKKDITWSDSQLLGYEKYFGIAGMASLYLSYSSYRGCFPGIEKPGPDMQNQQQKHGKVP